LTDVAAGKERLRKIVSMLVGLIKAIRIIDYMREKRSGIKSKIRIRNG
jgi:hypothetical protein